MSWKRRVESFITSQCAFVKFNLSIVTISTLTFGGLSLAQVNPDAVQPSSFDIYRSIRTAEVVVNNTQDLPKEETLLVAFDVADDYIKEVFGSPVPSKMSAVEAALKAPLSGASVDNGPAPVPHKVEKEEIASVPQTTQFNSRGLLWPMRGGNVSSRFGMRWGRMHQGTDIAAPHGSPVLAAGGGKVVFSGWEGGYGNLVIIDHGNGTKTKYGHCSKLLVSVGEKVNQGDIIAKVGSTGHSTGPHLHYEVINSGKANNPEFFTRRR